MVEAGELQDLKVLVAAIGERLTDGRKVLRGRDLSVKASTEGQHRDVQLGEVRGRVIGEEVAVPGRGHGGDDAGHLRIRHRAFELVGEIALDGVQVFFIGDDGEDFALAFGGAVGLGLGLSTGNGELADLLGQEIGAADARAGEQDDEGYVLIAGGNHGSNLSAFAVADETDAGDLGTLLEEGYRSFNVGGEVGGGGIGELAAALAEAALIHAKNLDAMAGEVVGEDEEGLVLHDLLVAVMRATACDEHDGGEGTVAFGTGEGSGQLDVGGRVPEGHILGVVGIGLYGRLRAVGGDGGRVLDAGERERKTAGALRPLAFDAVARGIELADEDTGDGFDVDGDIRSCDGDGGERYAARTLVNAVHGAGEAAGSVLDVEEDSQRKAVAHREAAEPVSLDAGRRSHGLSNSGKGEGKDGQNQKKTLHKNTSLRAPEKSVNRVAAVYNALSRKRKPGWGELGRVLRPKISPFDN